MAILKGFYNDFIRFDAKYFCGLGKFEESLAIQVTGADQAKIYRVEQSSTKSIQAIDFAQYNQSTFNIYAFENLINEIGISEQELTLDNNCYYQLLAYDKSGKLDDKTIGEGSFGTVISAIDSHNNLVAIKQFKEEKEWQQELANCDSLKKLKVPEGIVLPIDYGKQHNKYNIVYPQGVGISEKIGVMGLEHLLISFKQLIDALAWFHRNNLYHGDVKLNNTVYTKSGLAFIDFGMLTDNLTQANNAMYFCPDLLSNEIDFKIEVFALGVCFYRMFAYEAIRYKRGEDGDDILGKTYLSYQSFEDHRNWQPHENWRSPYAASFEELELLQQGIFSREFIPSQRATLTALFQLIKDMLILNSQHRPSSEEISQRIHKLQGSFS